MKKVKVILCTMILSIGLVGNVFAGNTVNSGFLGFFDNIVNSVVSLIAGPIDCPPRRCQTCRPGSGNDADGDGNGNCRPPR